MDTYNKENSDSAYESSTGGEASADYIIRGQRYAADRE